MTNHLESGQSKSERTLLTALLLSAPGPIVTGISVALSFSTTQIADFSRRSAELVAIFVAWWTYRQLRHEQPADDTRVRLERLANLSVAGAMGCTGVTMLIIVAFRLSSSEPYGNVTMGLVIAWLGLLTNTWFWLRYRALTRVEFDAVIAAQQRLYRAKSCVDFCVVVALTAVAVAPTYWATRYVDILGSVIVACFLLANGFAMVRRKPELSENLSQ